QAEDGIRDLIVTGVQTCALPIYRNREELEKQGILFADMDTALREYPDVVKRYFGTVIPSGDNVFAALNSAVWSGGCLTSSAMVKDRKSTRLNSSHDQISYAVFCL